MRGDMIFCGGRINFILRHLGPRIGNNGQKKISYCFIGTCLVPDMEEGRAYRAARKNNVQPTEIFIRGVG
jgi:hypothetical protein